jgi:hypothetical protein
MYVLALSDYKLIFKASCQRGDASPPGEFTVLALAY